MSDFTDIINEINTNIVDNTTQAITAKKLRDTLIDLTECIEDQQGDFETDIQGQIDNFEIDVQNIVEGLTGTTFVTGQKVSEVSIVNDLTTGGSGNTLSAQQGVALKQTIADTKAELDNYNELQDNMIGNVNLDIDYFDDFSLTVGGVNVNQLGSINFTTSTSYRWTSITVTANTWYYVGTMVRSYTGGAQTQYPYFIYLTDDNGVIKEMLAYADVTIDTWKEYKIKIPASGVTKMYVMEIYSSAYKQIQIGLLDYVDLQTQITTAQGKIDSNTERIVTIEDKIGNVKYNQLNTTGTTQTGGCRVKRSGEGAGTTIDFTSSTGYRTKIYSASMGQWWYVRTFCNSSVNYDYYMICTDDNGVITEKYLFRPSTDSFQSTIVKLVNANTTTVYVNIGSSNPANGYGTEIEWYDLQTQINDLGGEKPESFEDSADDYDWFRDESEYWIVDRYMEDKYWESESATTQAFISTITGRTGMYHLATISDTHGSGAYTWKSINHDNPTKAVSNNIQTCFRPIQIFNKLVPYCNAAMHGGDFSCDYGTSRKRVLKYMYEIVRKFNWTGTQPFFITKGNHDENNNGYSEVRDITKLDWAHNTYFTRSFATFTQVTRDTWNGSPLYVESSELVSDNQFRNTIQQWLAPTSNIYWGPGAYYYYDNTTYKIRIIVANSFPVDDEYQGGGGQNLPTTIQECEWLANEALDLSDYSSDASNWSVLMIRHSEVTSLGYICDIINAFRTGGSVTYNGTTYNYTNINGGAGNFIGHFHGHEHGNCVSNSRGFMDIGLVWGCISLSDLGNAEAYGLGCLSIDTTNKIVYHDVISGEAYKYDYANNKIMLKAGKSVALARSGGGAYPVSGDTEKATVSGTGAAMAITGVSAGNVNVYIYASQAAADADPNHENPLYTYYFTIEAA